MLLSRLRTTYVFCYWPSYSRKRLLNVLPDFQLCTDVQNYTIGYRLVCTNYGKISDAAQ